MSRRPKGDPDVSVMQDIVARINSLGELVDDLMLFARPRPPQPVDLHLHPLIADAITLVRRDPAGAGITISVDGGDTAIYVDAGLMRAALVNLLLNAAQAVGKGGTVLVRTMVTASTVTVEIRDDGPGIPADIRDRVARAFLHHEGARRRTRSAHRQTQRSTTRWSADPVMSGSGRNGGDAYAAEPGASAT